jgi:septal ring-binding cell division protein DamX
MVGAGILVLAAVGIAGMWYYRENPNAFAFGRGSTAPPITTFTYAAPPTTMDAAPPTTLAPVPPPTTRATVPATTLAAAPTPVSVPTPVARPLATPRPAPPPPTSAPAANLLDQARRALRSGNYDEAARAFAAHIRRAPAGTATIQLLVACSTDTVQKAMSEVGSAELFILPVSYKGRDCYRMAWGIYPDSARAASAVRSLPEYFRRGGATPRVMPAADVAP